MEMLRIYTWNFVDSFCRRSFWIALILTSINGNDLSMAATFKVVDRPECHLEIDGTINVGDSRKFRQLANAEFERIQPSNSFLTDTEEPTLSVCLNSPGGELIEATGIAKQVADQSIGTVVSDGQTCLSACSIIFMMGSRPTDLGMALHRKLHVRGKLGFHRPSIKQNRGLSRVSSQMFDLANDALLELLELFTRYTWNNTALVKPDLIQMMLSHREQNFFLIDTVGKALRWEIEIFGYETQRLIGAVDAIRVCLNLAGAASTHKAGEFDAIDYDHEWLTDERHGRPTTLLKRIAGGDGSKQGYYYEVMMPRWDITKGECLVGAVRWDQDGEIAPSACGGSWTGVEIFSNNAFCLINNIGDFDFKGEASNPDLMKSIPMYAIFRVDTKLEEIPSASITASNRLRKSPHLRQILESMGENSCAGSKLCGPGVGRTLQENDSVQNRKWRRVVNVNSDDVLWIRSCGSARCEKVGHLQPDQTNIYITECNGVWCKVHDAADKFLGWSNSKYLSDWQ